MPYSSMKILLLRLIFVQTLAGLYHFEVSREIAYKNSV